MKSFLVCAIVAIAACGAGAGTAAAADTDPVVGTWQLNTSKSTFKSGPTITSQTRKYSQSGDKITLEMTTVTADGKEQKTHTTYELNGKDFPVTGTQDYDSISAKQVNAQTAQFTLKKNGKAVGHTSRTISKDGKTLTSKSRLMRGGEMSESVLVLDRQ